MEIQCELSINPEAEDKEFEGTRPQLVRSVGAEFDSNISGPDVMEGDGAGREKASGGGIRGRASHVEGCAGTHLVEVSCSLL